MLKGLTDLMFPKPMTTLQVVGVQDIAGRKHDYIRVFGYDINDLRKRVREVAVTPLDAYEIIREADTTGQYPEIEVPSKSVVYVLNISNLTVLERGTPA